MSALLDIHAGDLARDGYCILRQALDPVTLAELEADLAPAFVATPMCEGVFYGHRTRRFGALLRRSSRAEALVRHAAVLAIVERMLLPWCERIALNLTQAIEIHPGAPAQFPHRDQDMWASPKGSLEYLVNVMWPLTPFTADNGGTRLWPGSHLDPDISDLPEEEAIVPNALPGDALLFLGSTLSPQPLEKLIDAEAATWLDRELVTADPAPLRDAGFGHDAQDAQARRRQWLIAQGFAEETDGRIAYRAGMIAALQRRELLRVGAQLSRELGMPFVESETGARMNGVYRRPIDTMSGRYALVEKSREFTLVPWRPVLDRHVGKSVSGIMRGDGISWSFGRSRTGPQIS